ncbi:hypothetical protein JYU19_02610 [bacterium AH-315-J21]|nr:hypothetical protein [bacterium AH-315-J21]
MKREIPLIITSIAGIVFAVSFFIPHWPFGDAENIFGDWMSVVSAFAIWLGMFNLAEVSLRKVIRKSEGWNYALIVIGSMILMLIIGFSSVYHAINTDTPHMDPGTGLKWMYDYVFAPLSATMFAMLAFFVASASYRAFRARSLEATLLLVTAFFVMVGRVPLLDPILVWAGITDFAFFSAVADWIMTYPNVAGQRAIMIGIALGIASSSLRIILGIERSHIGGDA